MNVDEKIRNNRDSRRTLETQRQKITGDGKLIPGKNPRSLSVKDTLLYQILNHQIQVSLIKEKLLMHEKRAEYYVDEDRLNEELEGCLKKIEELEDKYNEDVPGH
jgi:hypothetical protein